MDKPPRLELQPSAAAGEKPRRGRPKGSTNKRSTDLVRYIEAYYGGLTPGQQAAAIGMVTPADLRRARKAARATRLPEVVVAMATKAKELATLLEIGTAEAWKLMAAERAELMPYVHQKRPLAIDLGGDGALLPVIMMAATPTGGQRIEGDYRQVEGNQGFSPIPVIEVSPLKSHDELQPLAGPGLEASPTSD